MTEREAFRMVYNELIECNLFAGHYDAKNGNPHFMYGVCAVMENIADKAGYLDEFDALFDHNMLDSERKAGK